MSPFGVVEVVTVVLVDAEEADELVDAKEDDEFVRCMAFLGGINMRETSSALIETKFPDPGLEAFQPSRD